MLGGERFGDEVERIGVQDGFLNLERSTQEPWREWILTTCLCVLIISPVSHQL